MAQHRREVPPPGKDDWVPCRAAGCGIAVPPSAIHQHELCMRAEFSLDLLQVARKHPQPCCPGHCARCNLCLDRLGWPVRWCERCQLCIDCCLGHAEDEDNPWTT